MKLAPDKQKPQIEYWVAAAEKDLPVMQHLFDSGDYHYALFIGHLVLEKMLKTLYVKNLGKIPPYKHKLLLLASKAKVELNDIQRKDFETLTNTTNG